MFKHWEEEASGEGVELMEKEENSLFFLETWDVNKKGFKI